MPNRTVSNEQKQRCDDLSFGQSAASPARWWKNGLSGWVTEHYTTYE